MKRLADNGILLALAGLVAFFSWATWAEQPSVGRAAARSVADAIGPGQRVAVVAGATPEDRAFADALVAALAQAGSDATAHVGTPAEVRETLDAAHATGPAPTCVAVSAVAAGWTFVDDLASRFPRWADVRVVRPESRRWPSFLLADNLRNVVSQIAVIALVAVGMTLVIAARGIDLSVGSLMALAAVTTTSLMAAHGGVDAGPLTQLGAGFAGVAVCASVGLVTGLAVTRFELPPFIATLGMMWVARGLAFELSGGLSIDRVPASFGWLGRGADLAGVPNVVVLMLTLYVAGGLLVHRTTLGRHLLAVGSNPRAAFLSGVPVARTLTFAYVACAALAGLGGVVLASQLQTGDPKFGQEYELYVITAVVVGGTSLSGGQARLFGTLLGALLISVIQVGMNLMHVGRFRQLVVLGALLVAAVLLDRTRRKAE